MKAKLLVFLVVLCFGLGILAGQAFSATAKKASGAGWSRHISQDFRVDAPGYEFYTPATRAAVKYLSGGARLGCLDIQPEVGAVIQHDQIGDTWYDFQKNGAVGRMISVTSDGYRHISWTYSDHEYPPGPRGVDANCKDPQGFYIGQVHADYGEFNAGYSNQTHLHDGTSVIIHHRTAGTPVWGTVLTIDDDVCGGFFTKHWDVPDWIQGNTSGQEGMWPKAEVLYDAVSGIDYIHIVLTEGNTNPVPVMVAYERCFISPTNAETLYCQNYVNGATATYGVKVNTNGPGQFAPISHFDSSTSVTPIVAVSPVSKRVGVAYLRPCCDGSGDYMNDVCWFESLNNGDDFIDGTQWPPNISQITDFGCTGTERAWHDLSLCYDYQDSLHVVYLTVGFDPEQPGYYQPGVGRIYHWSKKSGVGMIHSKLQGGTEPGAHNAILAKMSVSAKDPVYHPGGDSVYLFCTWTQFDSSDNSGSDLSNGDLFGSGSFDGGNTWGGIFNLTHTHTPGCNPGECVSEHWSSMAQNMYDGDLHIEYICDRDAGGASQDQSQWISNPVMYLHLTEWEVGAEARSSYRIDQPTHWYHPPIKVTPGGSRTLIFKVFSIGNANLIWSASSADACVQGSGGGTLFPRDSATVTLTVDGSGACSGTLIDAIVELNTNEGVAGTTFTLPVQAVAAEDYYECPKDPETVDTLYNGVLALFVNANCGEAIRDSASYPDTAHDVFFEGGTIIATTMGGDTLVGRYMREDRHAGVRESFCHFDGSDYHVVHTSEIFIHDLEPPADYRWWWWEMSKEVVFFESNATDARKHIVIKFITVRRHDPPTWWPDQTPFAGYEDAYIGVAEDIDCPWDSSQGELNVTTEENATNLGGYDAANEIAWQQGFGSGEHPTYSNYYCGIALADADGDGPQTEIPYGTYCVKNNLHLYPQDGWGWKDGELCWLASHTGNNFQDEDSLVDRSYVFTAAKIEAGSDPDKSASFTVIMAAAPGGLADLQAYVDTGRAWVANAPALGLRPWRLCGDANADGVVQAGDIVFLLSYLFRNGPAPKCPFERGDANGDGTVQAGDVVYLISYLFRNGPLPDCPGPLL